MDGISHPESHIAPAFLRRRESETASKNERRVLDLVRRAGSTSRAELARATDLTAQSISRIVDELEERGLLTLGERVANGRGQPSVSVRLAPTALYTLGLSLMTDAVALSLLDFSGAVVAERYTPLSAMSREAVFAFVETERDAMLTSVGADASRLFAMGVGVSGYFVGERGFVNPPEPLEDWALVDLGALFTERLGLPVWVDNDGNAAAVGEAMHGVGRSASTFAYLFFTNGLGGGLVINGEPMRGAHGNAGEFAGVLPLHRLDERPTLELLRSMVNARGGDLASVSDVVAGFDPEWPGVEAWVERARGPLIEICSAIHSVIDPEAIVLGGRMPTALAELVIPHIAFHNLPRRGRPRPVPKIVASAAGGDATSIGAASMPLKAHFFV